MKSAQEARMAMASFDPTELPDYKKVETEIENAINDNKNNAFLWYVLDPRLIKFLKSKGYEVEIGNDRNDFYTKITW